jgi:hypothetical protein
MPYGMLGTQLVLQVTSCECRAAATASDIKPLIICFKVLALLHCPFHAVSSCTALQGCDNTLQVLAEAGNPFDKSEDQAMLPLLPYLSSSVVYLPLYYWLSQLMLASMQHNSQDACSGHSTSMDATLQVLRKLASADLAALGRLLPQLTRASSLITDQKGPPGVASSDHHECSYLELNKALIAASSRGLSVIAPLLSSSSTEQQQQQQQQCRLTGA